tara:strand:- start:5686 stop:5916 length:231 start_codon:yes stop_codon:yes gene_type:complete
MKETVTEFEEIFDDARHLRRTNEEVLCVLKRKIASLNKSQAHEIFKIVNKLQYEKNLKNIVFDISTDLYNVTQRDF